MKKIALLAALLGALPLLSDAATAAATTAPARSLEQQVDALFARWRQPGTPGAVVEVIRDGKVLLSKAYGMADLERHAPLTPASRIAIGSNSKQFTAFCIHLLAQDGKLALDDDIHRYLPELPDYGTKITIRHLLHHTSGLRDYFELLFLTGTHGDDVITEDDALTVVERQHALNFAPGAEHLYSNTGYLLLGQIVARVSGKPLAEFARERIFAPLGMTHTQFQHGYGTLVPDRALSYVADGAGGYRYVAVAESVDGAGGVVTTAGDLALWDSNFYDGRVGGKELVARMQVPGVLNNGTQLGYASGLVVGEHRGRRLVEHGGSIGGFQTQLARFPDQHLSVVVLSNANDLNLYETVRRIADLYLDPALAAPPPPAAPRKTYTEVAVDPARLAAYAGYYALSPQRGIAFRVEHGRLVAKATGWPDIPVFAYGERDFFAKVIDSQFTFDAPGPDGVVAGGVLHQNGADMPARRMPRPTAPAEGLKKFEGDFYSDELRAVYSVANRGGVLELTHPRGTVALDVDDKGNFTGGFPFASIAYQCAAQDRCSGFTVSNERMRNVQFQRVALPR